MNTMHVNKVVWGAMASLGLSMTFGSCTAESPAKKELNVLFIAVDDLRPELNCYGNNRVISPNIDRLANQGVLFERAYCQQAICMASRASLFTGLYPSTNRIYSCLSVDELMPGQLTINQLFSQAGYDVYGTGKLYHHGVDHQKQFGEVWMNTRTWEGDKSVGRGYITPEAIAQNTFQKGPGRVQGPAWEIADAEDNEYKDGFTAEWVVNKLGELKKSEKPFFLGVGFAKPHLPFNAPRKYWDLYNPDEITTANNPFFPVNSSTYSQNNFGELRNYSNIPGGDTILSFEIQKRLIHGYRACVSFLDAQIGKVLDALEANGLAENTVVILWGDHGWKLGDHGMWCKHTNFEVDTHVPLIIAAPGYKRNVRTASFAEFVDLFPTLADLCGMDVPDHLHGKSLVPVLQDPSTSVKDQAFSVYPAGSRENEEKVILGYSVRTDRFRYTEWRYKVSGEILDRELYDHASSGENVNVVNNPNYAPFLPELQAKISQFSSTY